MSLMKCYYQNVRGLRSKLDDVRQYLSYTDNDVICLTETWLNDSVNTLELFPIHFNIYRKDRDLAVNSKKDGGGVLIAVRKSLISERIEYLETDDENIWIRILTGNPNNSRWIYICVAYFPPEMQHMRCMILFMKK
jgi:exonuclease III